MGFRPSTFVLDTCKNSKFFSGLPSFEQLARAGGAEGNRTPDLCSAIAALSHLSYGPARSGDAGSYYISDRAAGMQSTAARAPSCFEHGTFIPNVARTGALGNGRRNFDQGAGD